MNQATLCATNWFSLERELAAIALLALDRKKLAAFSALGGGFERAPKPYKRDSSGVAPASPQVAYRALLERCIGRPPKKVGRIFGPRRESRHAQAADDHRLVDFLMARPGQLRALGVLPTG